MDRRTVLRRTAAAGALFLAGCTGSSEEKKTLNVANIDFYEGENGFLTVSVTVANVGNQPQSGTLLVHAKLNGESKTRVRDVSLDAHETKTITITYDVKMADVENFSVNADVTQD